ncbi:MAG: hypothetical protein ABSD21_08010 [Rhizomicrobium sp.]
MNVRFGQIHMAKQAAEIIAKIEFFGAIDSHPPQSGWPDAIHDASIAKPVVGPKVYATG